MTSNRMYHPKADLNRMHISRKEGGREMTNLEMGYKITTIGLNSYLQSSGDRILHADLQHEKKKKLHSVVKEIRKFKLQISSFNTKSTKAAKDIKKKNKNASSEDMKKSMEREATTLHEKYPLRTGNADIDRATTHQWLRSLSLKRETEGFIFAAQDQSISTRAYESRILNNGADPNFRLCTEKKRKERVDLIVSACPTIVNTEYLQREDESLVSYTGYYVKISTGTT